MVRLDRTKLLLADGRDEQGRRYWLRSTLLDYIKGKVRRAINVYVQLSPIDGMAAPESRARALLNGTIISVQLSSPTEINAIRELVDHATTAKAQSVSIGASYVRSPLFPALMAFAAEEGLSVILVPDM
jgi:hypothetical protein